MLYSYPLKMQWCVHIHPRLPNYPEDELGTTGPPGKSRKIFFFFFNDCVLQGALTLIYLVILLLIDIWGNLWQSSVRTPCCHC